MNLNTRRPFLSRIDERARRNLLAVGSSRRYARNDRLMTMGEPGTHVMLLISGVVKVVGEDAFGTPVILDIAVAGDVLGEAAVLADSTRMASVVCLSHVEARRVSSGEFRTFIDHQPGATKELLMTVVQRFSMAQTLRSATNSPLSLDRLATRLLYLLSITNRTTDSGYLIDIPLSREELAQFVPMGRTSLITSLTELENRGIITRSRMSITVTDYEALSRLARPDTS